MKKQTIKSISFVFLTHILSVVNILLCRNDLIVDVIWLALQIILCIIVIPAYFLVKKTPLRKWSYTVTSFIAHVVFTLVACFVLGSIFSGWDTAIIYWTEIFLLVSFGTIFLIDLNVNVKS